MSGTDEHGSAAEPRVPEVCNWINYFRGCGCSKCTAYHEFTRNDLNTGGSASLQKVKP